MKLYRQAIVIGTICVGFFAGVPAAIGDSSKEAELVGVLREVTFLGPPGFGENPATDQRITVPVLKIAHFTAWPLDPGGKVISGGNEVEVIMVDSSVMAKYLGKCVTVSGNIEKRTMASEYSPFVIFVSKAAITSGCQ